MAKKRRSLNRKRVKRTKRVKRKKNKQSSRKRIKRSKRTLNKNKKRIKNTLFGGAVEVSSLSEDLGSGFFGVVRCCLPFEVGGKKIVRKEFVIKEVTQEVLDAVDLRKVEGWKEEWGKLERDVTHELFFLKENIGNPFANITYQQRPYHYLSAKKGPDRLMYYFYIDIQKVDGVNLYTALTKMEGASTLPRWGEDVPVIFKQIAIGIKLMHDQGIIHRDLKLENIIYDEESKKITILDFGLAYSPKGCNWGKKADVVMSHKEPVKTRKCPRCGLFNHDYAGKEYNTITYPLGAATLIDPKTMIAANPRLNYEPKELDIFALGRLLYLLYEKNEPFKDSPISNKDEFLSMVDASKFNNILKDFVNTPDKYQLLIRRMLNQEEGGKPTIDEILEVFKDVMPPKEWGEEEDHCKMFLQFCEPLTWNEREITSIQAEIRKKEKRNEIDYNIGIGNLLHVGIQKLFQGEGKSYDKLRYMKDQFELIVNLLSTFDSKTEEQEQKYQKLHSFIYGELSYINHSIEQEGILREKEGEITEVIDGLKFTESNSGNDIILQECISKLNGLLKEIEEVEDEFIIFPRVLDKKRELIWKIYTEKGNVKKKRKDAISKEVKEIKTDIKEGFREGLLVEIKTPPSWFSYLKGKHGVINSIRSRQMVVEVYVPSVDSGNVEKVFFDLSEKTLTLDNDEGKRVEMREKMGMEEVDKEKVVKLIEKFD